MAGHKRWVDSYRRYRRNERGSYRSSVIKKLNVSFVDQNNFDIWTFNMMPMNTDEYFCGYFHTTGRNHHRHKKPHTTALNVARDEKLISQMDTLR